MKEQTSNTIDNFIEEYKETFNTSDKKAVFLEGVLSQFLLDVQYAMRGSKSFSKKLHGLKLDETRIKKLLPAIVEKFREYDAGYYPWLEKMVSKYLIEAEKNGWNLSKDEISYYFTLGLTLAGMFKPEKNIKKKNPEEGRSG